jgi:hypothetical protein
MIRIQNGRYRQGLCAVAVFRVPSSPEPKVNKDIKQNDLYKSQIGKRRPGNAAE